ncbi:ArdC family protein [Alloalcanivorax xenomutans]|uniref:ArdC family protein n=1 Tax=Alloalcanivorax xenomutans TaxID=1094342 RepID=UPI003BAC1444
MDIYESVTQRIITALEHGTPPWIKPWSCSTGGSADGLMPNNAISGRPYQGINILVLWIAAADQGYASARWLTYRQAQAAGGHVRRNEQATLACLYRPMERPEQDDQGHPILDDDGHPKMKRFAIVRGVPLFNIEQCEGLPDDRPSNRPATATDFRPHEDAERLIQATGADLEHVAGDQAYYSHQQDRIRLPLKGQFRSEGDYYATALHELAHWSGHPTRLNRDGIRCWSGFGSEEYAYEELIAEITAAFLCGHLGLEGKLQHESYIANWLKALRNDKRLIFRASGEARTAADFLQSFGTTRQEGKALQDCA